MRPARGPVRDGRQLRGLAVRGPAAPGPDHDNAPSSWLLKPILQSSDEPSPLLIVKCDAAAVAIGRITNHDDVILDSDLYTLTAVAVSSCAPCHFGS